MKKIIALSLLLILFISGASFASTLSAPSNVAVSPLTITRTTAIVSWTPSTDSNSSATINYTVNVSTSSNGSNPTPTIVPSSACNNTACSQQVSNLTKGQVYYVSVAASDGVNNAASPYIPFSYSGANFIHIVSPANLPALLYDASSTTELGWIPHAGSIAYIPVPTVAPATYNLYSQSSSGWTQCTFTVTPGASPTVSTSPNCGVGQASFLPPGAKGNPQKYYHLGLSADSWQPAQAAPSNPFFPSTTSPVPRTFTFVNNTKYAEIAIAAIPYVAYPGAPSFCYHSDGSSYSPTGPLCNAQLINQGDSYSYGSNPNYNSSGRPSMAYVVSGYSTQANCAIGDQSCWITSSGYNENGPAHASKYEISWLNINGEKLFPATNLDLSAADGFTFAATIYPVDPNFKNQPVYCQWGTPQTAGVFNKQNPLASIQGGYTDSNGNTYHSLEGLCLYLSSQPFLPISKTHPDQQVNLMMTRMINNVPVFAGCVSPAKWSSNTAAANNTQLLSQFYFGLNSPDKFQCTGKYSKSATCDAAGFVTNSAYFTTLKNAFENTYLYPYHDSSADYGCPGTANFVVNITSIGGTALSAPTGVTANPSASDNSATISWTAPSGNNIVYRVTALSHSGNPAATAYKITGTSTSLTPLAPGDLYDVYVTADDQDNNEATSTPITLQMPGLIAPANISVSDVYTDAKNNVYATLSWNPSTGGQGQVSYIVTLYDPTTFNILASYPTSVPSIQLNNTNTNGVLANGQSYAVRVQAKDAAGDVSPYSSIFGFTEYKFTAPFITSVDSQGNINFNPSHDADPQPSIGAPALHYKARVSLNPDGSAPYAVQSSSTESPISVSLKGGFTYYTTVKAKDDRFGGSATSNLFSVTIPSTYGLVPVAGVSAVPGTITPSGMQIQYTLPANPYSGNTPPKPWGFSYQVYVNGVYSGQSSATGEPITLSGLQPGTSYNIAVVTNDGVYGDNAESTVAPISTLPNTLKFTVKPSGDNNETYTPSSIQTVDSGATQTFNNVTAKAGYTLGSVTGTCGGSFINSDTYTTSPITSNCTVIFSATQNAPTSVVVTASSSDGNETINPPTQTVVVGKKTQFTVTPTSGYAVSSTVGGTCPAGSFNGDVYTTGAITSACSVNFTATKTAPVSGTLTIPANGFREIRSSGVQGQLRWLVQASGFTPSQMSCSFVIAANGATAPCTCGNVGGGTWRCETSVFRPPSIPGRYTVTVGNTAPGAPPVSAPYQMSR